MGGFCVESVMTGGRGGSPRSPNQNGYVYCSTGLSCSITPRPHSDPALQLGPLSKWGNWQGGDFPKVTQSVKGRARIGFQVSLIPGPVGHSVAPELTCEKSSLLITVTVTQNDTEHEVLSMGQTVLNPLHMLTQ